VDLNSSQKRTNGNNHITLIDLEDLYAADLQRPEKLPAGSAGYAHKSVKRGVWSADADRFSGAVLIANMLGWSNRIVREMTYGEQYFDDSEMQEDCERYQKIVKILEDDWGTPPADLFTRAWQSSTLDSCPSFSEWSDALKIETPSVEILDAIPKDTPRPSVLSNGPVTGWRSISGEHPTSHRPAGNSQPGLSKSSDEYYYEFMEWDQIQNLRKKGYLPKGNTSDQRQQITSTNNNNIDNSDDSNQNDLLAKFAFWFFLVGGLIGIILLLWLAY